MPRAFIRHLKEDYPKGTRIELELMNDPLAPVEPGTRGTVVTVDDAGQILMQWDNGRTLALVPTEDDFRKLTLEEIMQEQGFELESYAKEEPPMVEESVYIVEKFDNGKDKFIAASFDKHEAIQLMNEAWDNLPASEKENTTFKTGTKTVDVPYGASVADKIAKLDNDQPNRAWTKNTQPLAECSLEHKNSNRMLVIFPNEHPCEVYIYDTLEAQQKMVDGYIECTYPFHDNAFVISNDEARINGMQGNRRINSEIYAGTILIAGDDMQGGTTDLTDRQINFYKEKLWQPETISPAEVANIQYKMFFFDNIEDLYDKSVGFTNVHQSQMPNSNIEPVQTSGTHNSDIIASPINSPTMEM